jgi:hypothetical protein
MMVFNQDFRSQASDLLLQCLDGLEGFAALMDRFYADRPFKIDFSHLLDEPPAERFGKILLFVKSIYTAKYRELVFATIEAANKKDFLVFALCGRSIIETTATFRYYNRKFQQQISSAKDPDRFDDDEIKEILEWFNKHSTGGRFDWMIFWNAPSNEMVQHLKNVKSGNESSTKLNPDQVNVVTTIDKWAKDEPAVRLAYDFFCELVHPNVGSSFMIMGSRNTELEVGAHSKKELAKSLAIEGVQFLAPSLREASDCFRNLIAWSAVANPEA